MTESQTNPTPEKPVRTLRMALIASLVVNLLLEVIRGIHGKRGYFEAANEFPNVEQVDIPVSPDAVRHHRFGPSLLYRYMPFWVATTLERFIIIVVPLLAVLLLNEQINAFMVAGTLLILGGLFAVVLPGRILAGRRARRPGR